MRKAVFILALLGIVDGFSGNVLLKASAADLVIAVGGEASMHPAWLGSARVVGSVIPKLGVRRAADAERFSMHSDSVGLEFGSIRAGGIPVSFGAVGRYVAARQPSLENSALRGLDIISATIEAGSYVELWIVAWLRVRAELLTGVIGRHGGINGQTSLTIIREVQPSVTLAFGPRLQVSDGHFNAIMFGVSPTAAARSGLPAGDPVGGVRSAGIQAQVVWKIDKSNWRLVAFVEYDSFIGAVARSALVSERGARNQSVVGAGLVYTFSEKVTLPFLE
jgi:MipA family protein